METTPPSFPQQEGDVPVKGRAWNSIADSAVVILHREKEKRALEEHGFKFVE
jgi:hypothetical protein